MIKEVWNKLTADQRNKITAALILEGVSSSAIYAWVRGERVPRKLYREAMSKYINKVTGLTTTPENLWPDAYN